MKCYVSWWRSRESLKVKILNVKNVIWLTKSCCWKLKGFIMLISIDIRTYHFIQKKMCGFFELILISPKLILKNVPISSAMNFFRKIHIILVNLSKISQRISLFWRFFLWDGVSRQTTTSARLVYSFSIYPTMGLI